MSNNLTGTITSELVVRCAKARFEHSTSRHINLKSWEALTVPQKSYWLESTRAVLEEAIKESVRLCRHCALPISLASDNRWEHKGSRNTSCQFTANPQ